MEKDLGVIMDGELKFHNHVTQAAKKASGVLAQIRRTMACHNETTITLLYKGIVRPLLEYANVIYQDTRWIWKPLKQCSGELPSWFLK